MKKPTHPQNHGITNRKLYGDMKHEMGDINETIRSTLETRVAQIKQEENEKNKATIKQIDEMIEDFQKNITLNNTPKRSKRYY